jgi:anthranilate synthase/aminodeoxychorismate synthase-like glutamine amidotransferase
VILLVDNHDSFTFNLVHSLERAGARVGVVRSDAASAHELLGLDLEALVLSPGPGRPEDAGVCMELLARCPATLPLLGVCLGHQALVLHHGGRLELDPEPVHGRSSTIYHDGEGLFEGLPDPLEAARYHSLRAIGDALPDALVRTAWTTDGEVMAVAHRSAPWFGVQFHPESILTPHGDALVARFVALAGAVTAARH